MLRKIGVCHLFEGFTWKYVEAKNDRKKQEKKKKRNEAGPCAKMLLCTKNTPTMQTHKHIHPGRVKNHKK